jgi:hypothetical protein
MKSLTKKQALKMGLSKKKFRKLKNIDDDDIDTPYEELDYSSFMWPSYHCYPNVNVNMDMMNHKMDMNQKMANKMSGKMGMMNQKMPNKMSGKMGMMNQKMAHKMSGKMDMNQKMMNKMSGKIVKRKKYKKKTKRKKK